MNKQAMYSHYYNLGREYALTKLAKKKEELKASKTTRRKTIGKSVGKATQKASPNIQKNLVGRYATKGQKALGKGVLQAGKRLGLGIDILDDIKNMSSVKGREKIKDKYRPYVIDDKDGLDSMAADALNALIPTNPVSSAASASRLVHRGLKGAKSMEERRVQTAKELEEAIRKGDTTKAQQKRDLIRQQTEMQPRFSR